MYTTQKQIRDAFWAENLNLEYQAKARKTRSKGQNAQTAECRQAFVEFVDHLARSGQISESLAKRVTL